MALAIRRFKKKLELIGIVPDINVLMYYVYGKSDQKELIHKQIYSDEKVVINPILLSEIGRVIVNSFFKLKNFIKSYISNRDHFLLDDFWINITFMQKKKLTESILL